MNSEFSKILKKKRYEMGISQETLAKKLLPFLTGRKATVYLIQIW